MKMLVKLMARVQRAPGFRDFTGPKGSSVRAPLVFAAHANAARPDPQFVHDRSRLLHGPCGGQSNIWRPHPRPSNGPSQSGNRGKRAAGVTRHSDGEAIAAG